jgi:hypothetical protein
MPAQTDQITMSRVFVKEVEPETIDLPDRTIDAAADHMDLPSVSAISAPRRAERLGVHYRRVQF